MRDNELEQYVQQHDKAIKDCLSSVREHLDSIADLFDIINYLQEEVQIWDTDVYGTWTRTMLSNLPKGTTKAIKQERKKVLDAKANEESERRLSEQAASRRAQEARELRKEARKH